MDIVPAGFALADDGAFTALEGQFGELINLAAAGEGGASSVACSLLVDCHLHCWIRRKRQHRHTIYRRRTHHRRLDLRPLFLPAVNHNLVHIPVERFAREVNELIDAFEVVEYLVRILAELAVARVEVGQDASAACVQPVAWARRRMAGGQAGGDGDGGVDVVGRICCVCAGINPCPMAGNYCGSMMHMARLGESNKL